jgi:nitrogen fixation protein
MKAVRLLEYGWQLEFNDVPSDDAAFMQAIVVDGRQYRIG